MFFLLFLFVSVSAECFRIPSKDMFSVQICQNTSIAGYIEIAKWDCNIFLKNDAFYNKHSREYARNVLGPLEYTVILEGPELIAIHPNAIYDGSCIYRFPFIVHRFGRYRINALLWRSNYLGSNEMIDDWPPIKPINPFEYDSEIRLGHPSFNDSFFDHRPYCSMKTSLYQHGSWVRQRYDYFEPVKFKGLPIYTQIDPKQYLWEPFLCKLKFFNQQDTQKCLRHNSLEIRGDSHMRTLFNTLVDHTCPKSHYEAMKGFYSTQCLNATHRCAKIDLCFKADPMLESQLKFTKKHTVINVGQHPADGRNRFPYSVYDEYLSKRINKTFPDTHIIWHETNAMRYRTDSFVKGYKDMRTPTRIMLYNKIAQKYVEKWDIIPSFEQTSALVLHHADPAHYSKTILKQSSLNVLLNLICR